MNEVRSHGEWVTSELKRSVPELAEFVEVHFIAPGRYYDIAISTINRRVSEEYCVLRRKDTRKWVVSPIYTVGDDKDIPTDSMADAVRLMVTMNELGVAHER